MHQYGEGPRTDEIASHSVVVEKLKMKAVMSIIVLLTSLLFFSSSLVDSCTAFTREASMEVEAGPGMQGQHEPIELFCSQHNTEQRMYSHCIMKRETERTQQMDPITTAIVTALSAGAVGGITDTAKAAITDAYNKIKELLTRKYGASSDVVQAIAQLEAKPESANRKGMLQEEIAAVKMMRDDEILAAAKHLLALVQPQQAGQGKVTIHQDHAIIQGQNIGDHQQVTQNFGNPPKAER